jgi:hypothetical protein
MELMIFNCADGLHLNIQYLINLTTYHKKTST